MVDPIPLTAEEWRTLTAVQSLTRDGLPPTLQEVAGALGYRSKSSAWLFVRPLIAKGVVCRPIPGQKWRALRVNRVTVCLSPEEETVRKRERPRKRPAHVVIHQDGVRAECTICGLSYAPTLPVSTKEFLRLLRQFERNHRDCDQKGGQP